MSTENMVVITTIPAVKRAIPNVHKSFDFLNVVNHTDLLSDDETGGTRKRRRLTHLTPDEKLLRR